RPSKSNCKRRCTRRKCRTAVRPGKQSVFSHAAAQRGHASGLNCCITRSMPGAMPLRLRPKDKSRWDLVALGEVMLRFDPGDGRISTARNFKVYEGGGEY